MPEGQLKKIADEADMIVAGYSFTKDKDGYIRILNLDNPDAACVLMETLNMDIMVKINNIISVFKQQQHRQAGRYNPQ